MKLYNSLTRKIEEFVPFQDKKVGLYTCGPTVYSYVTIGNWRTYFLGDIVVRTLQYLGYETDYVMNITDVGHLTGDNLGDASTGDDRLEKAAQKENKTAWDIAKMYTDDFYRGYDLLDLSKPKVFCKATDHIVEQIEMVKIIEGKGFVYKTSDGLYFDTAKYEVAGNTYGQLSNIDQVKEGARVEPNPEKKDPRDFALWKFSYPNGRDFDPKQDNEKTRRQMEWESPWGLGFPGWHIECSAMAQKYLGDQFDIHIGGEDLRSTHHPNEIAQSECATGKKPFVKYWMHGAFLQVEGGRMGKSLGNAYTLTDIINRGYTIEHVRYFYLTGHYRQPLNFTWESLENAKRSLDNLLNKIVILERAKRPIGSPQDLEKGSEASDSFPLVKEGRPEERRAGEILRGYKQKFIDTLSNDLQMPQVLALVWDMLKDDKLQDADKVALIMDWDKVLGLGISDKLQVTSEKYEYKGTQTGIKIKSGKELSQEVINLIDQREIARLEKNWLGADEIRQELKEKGIEVKDGKGEVSTILEV
jgi:cysteinyl-tRNA synthetase